MKLNDSLYDVGLQILDNEKNGKISDFASLVRTLDGRITRNEISKSIDKLSDLAMIRQTWRQLPNKKFTRVMELTYEGKIIFEPIYDKVIKDDD